MSRLARWFSGKKTYADMDKDMDKKLEILNKITGADGKHQDLTIGGRRIYTAEDITGFKSVTIEGQKITADELREAYENRSENAKEYGYRERFECLDLPVPEPIDQTSVSPKDMKYLCDKLSTVLKKYGLSEKEIKNIAKNFAEGWIYRENIMIAEDDFRTTCDLLFSSKVAKATIKSLELKSESSRMDLAERLSEEISKRKGG